MSQLSSRLQALVFYSFHNFTPAGDSTRNTRHSTELEYNVARRVMTDRPVGPIQTRRQTSPLSTLSAAFCHSLHTPAHDDRLTAPCDELFRYYNNALNSR